MHSLSESVTYSDRSLILRGAACIVLPIHTHDGISLSHVSCVNVVQGRRKACHSKATYIHALMQIKRLALRPLPRSFGPLRKIELDQPGAGFLITCPPDLTSSKVGRQVLSNSQQPCQAV